MRDAEDDAPPIYIGFDGGDFTEPEEIITLSDMETKSLRLKNSRVEVILNPSSAFAVGDRQEAEDIYRVWARSRQTSIRPRRRLSNRLRSIELSTFPMILVLFILNFSMGDKLLLGRNNIMPGVIVLLATIAAMAIIAFFVDRASMPSYAIVIPLSLKEHRENRSSQMYPRRSWIVAIVAAIIAATAVGVAIWAVLSR